ncbi:MAG: hypothetical protein E6J62_19835 [Deltaproteobacteria bacterium]|nr:MAG: hypothetical protein E6J62_19835 [Deltaproteobacteria bacterium]
MLSGGIAGARGGPRARWFRVAELSLQSNHLHLIAEADDQAALSRGIQALAIRVAKRLNAEVVNAVDYVLSNWFRHAGREVSIDDIDRLSSVADRSLVVRPQTWLLRMAWTKAG